MIVEEQGIDFWTRVQIPSGPLKVLQCLGEWCCSTFFVCRAIQMIRDVDHSEVISARLIDSPVLGPISPKELSGGVKTLILIAYDTGNKVFNASACGDNCAQWLLRLGEQKEVTINLRHVMNFGNGPFQIKILNTDSIVMNMLEFVQIAGNFV